MKLYAPKDVKIKTNTDNLVQNKTSFTLNWNASKGARYYEIQLNDGKTTEKIKVKNATSYTTKAVYDLTKNYTATVKAFFEDDATAPETEEDKLTGQRGLSDASNSALAKSVLHEELIGLEDYFTYEESTFGNATASVNVTTGNMAVQFTDESLYTRSDLGYDFTRTYNSRSTTSSSLGKGWTFVGNEMLTETESGDVNYFDEDGTVHLFKKSGASFISPKGLYEQLEKKGSTFTMTDQNNFVQTYQEGRQTGTYVISSYKDEYDNEIYFTRNDKGQVTEVAETKGTSNQEKIKISYVDDRISQVQYGDHWTKYSYTDAQLTQTVIGSEKSTRTIVEKFTYDNNGQLTKYVDGQKNETTFKYNANEFIIFDKQATDEELSVTNTYQFDAKNNEYKAIDSSDAETIYKRDEKNNTYAVVEENAPGDDEQNTTSFYTYDTQYNLLEVINPDASTEKNTYDGQGNLLTSITKEGTVTNTYNSRNQLLSTKDTNGEETTYTYDGPSLIRSKVKDEETTYVYDTYGRVTETTFANGTFEQVDYDDEQRQVTSTDKKGNTTSVVYSIYGQKVKETDADGHTKSYTYDPMYPSTILSVTDGNGHKTAYQYDNNNNLTTLTDALNREKTYSYNDNDQVTAVMMPKMKFAYKYDENGEMSKSTLPSGITTTYAYNSDGQLSQVENGDETIAYGYDENGNTTSILRDTKPFKAYGYTDETNLLANYTLGLFKQNYGYDEKERNNAVTTAYGEDFTVKEATTFKENSDDVDHIQISADQISHDYQSEIDVPNNKTTLTLNDDLWKQVTQMNDANLLGSLTYTTKAQQPFKIAYDYTKNGNIAQADVNGQVSSFVYDANDQLTKETLPDGTMNTYKYDEVGNRTASEVNGEKATFTYNDANQIAAKNEIAYTYDADGNLLKDENYKYTYNQQQSLTKVTTLDDQTIASYTYDENGLRLTKTIGDKTHEYFYNAEVLEMEVVKVKDTVTEYRSYEWSGYTPLGMIIKKQNKSGTFETKAYQFITNHRGDVLSIRDSEDQEVGAYTYDAYGNVLTVEGDLAKENPIRYAGYYYDEETKNYYLQARYYNPANGAFLALDPHPGDDDEPLSQNGYTYGDNNPVGELLAT
ncbi:RHS repeat-associated core domain-containing protein [Kurthia zopfii]|uniref:RHS repeat-associated core domain-containing protein n=1 Tax=Kurthia zopfii TaxID=1650 RepID=UPI000F71AA77|nr:RHS repeat-associated core domain-containing protein [Kurthia zopfii]VEI08219.1 Cell wall-associated polypeptide CWBP200 [Kurthia zopfii]